MPGRYALIVAGSDYSDARLKQLRAPGQDARELAEVLGNAEIGGFNVETLVNASTQTVREAIERFFLAREGDDTLLLYFSCHGVKDKKGRLYFATSTTNLGLLGSTGVGAQFVNDQLEGSRSRRIVLMLDCCYSGAFSRGFASRGDSAMHVQERFEGEGRVILTASDALEYAFEEDALDSASPKPSVFTSAVVSGLRNGEADLDRDGRVSVDDLYDYVFAKVRERSAEQTPTKSTTVKGMIYVARNPNLATRPINQPGSPFANVTSNLSWERSEAAIELKRLSESTTNSALAERAREALETLAADQDNFVRALALEELGEVARSHYERGLVVLRLGDKEGAIQEFRQAYESQTELRHRSAFNLGLLTQDDDIEVAANYYRAVLSSDDYQLVARACLNLGCILEAQGQTDSALTLYEKATASEEELVRTRAALLLGRRFELLGDYVRACRAYKVASRSSEDVGTEAENRYVWLVKKLGTADLVADLFDSASVPDDGWSSMTLARLYADEGDRDRAAEYYRKVIANGNEYSEDAAIRLRDLGSLRRWTKKLLSRSRSDRWNS
jgi:tetratricopeptide (TPR) repeat protein